MKHRERGRTRLMQEEEKDRKSEGDQNSYFDYSEDYDTSEFSDRSPTPRSMSRSPQAKRMISTMRSITPVQNRGFRKVGSKFSPHKGGANKGFRSQSLNKVSPPKDIAVITKRVLSARLLKINELQNELTEQQMILEELQKENKTLKKLKVRQEKALNKFGDTESEISQLISRHNNEIRTLKEHLRKSQERERNTERRLKDAEHELYTVKISLTKLKELSENRHLPEREELTKKLNILETKLEERETRVKDLEKNIGLIQNSFQRQLQTEKKKAHDAQEEKKLLQEKFQKLTLTLKEKEREIEAKNIFAHRLSKTSPKKDIEITPRNKAPTESKNISVQTIEPSLLSEFSLPPPMPVNQNKKGKERQQEFPGMVQRQQNLEKELKEKAEKIRKDNELEERKQEQEAKQQREREQIILEEKAQRLREEWEKEESERKKKDNILHQDKLEKENNIHNVEEERNKKELLLAKMFEIDRENDEAGHSVSIKAPSKKLSLESTLKDDTKERKLKTYTFTEPTENLFNGRPAHTSHESNSTTHVSSHRNRKKNEFSRDFTFGTYAPSFAKSRSGGQRENAETLDKANINNSKLNIQTDRKSDLMEQLFGNNSSSTHPSKGTDSKANVNSNTDLPWETSKDIRVKKDLPFSGDSKNGSPSRHRTHHVAGKLVVKAVDFVEDEIEEVPLF
ncbi:hypothetical protein GDO86_009468 [Hymenochirus boettgeri]|uniref:Lebercilin domain-containing protein n=1 Tax=Hymenochirus boettgeri TaxID=247094 RepID=A0A8T2JL98_9PIPI|nr:hypothetical protein GDO86_009468 [Hymenochirus boettgeri]